MSLYLMRASSAFSMVTPIGEWEAHVWGGKAVNGPWRIIDFCQVGNQSKEFIPVDCLTANISADGFLFSSYARNIIAPLICENDNFWPVTVMGYDYWWLNCLSLVDALDQLKTDADWSIVEGDWGVFRWITTTRSLTFRSNALQQAPALFRIPEFPQGILFASDTLYRAIRDHALTGFTFELVWSAAHGAKLDPAGLTFKDIFVPLSNDELVSERETARLVIAERDACVDCSTHSE